MYYKCLPLARELKQNSYGVNNMNEYLGDKDYAIWKERSIIADCLRDLGLSDLATQLHTPTCNGDIMPYIHLIQKIADKTKNNDVLDRLYFAGLIYG